jgi:hypothetical protein
MDWVSSRIASSLDVTFSNNITLSVGLVILALVGGSNPVTGVVLDLNFVGVND